MSDLTARKNIRLKGYNYSNPGTYFITVCVKDKHEILGKIVGDAVLCVPHVELSYIGKFVKTYLDKTENMPGDVIIEKYVIMPNHVHLLIRLNGGTQRTASPTKAAIPRIVHGMKAFTTKNIGFSFWQRSYHDHIIRNKAEYFKISEYIDTNPMKWTEDFYFIKNEVRE